jgi:hypothetical protein
MPKRKSASQPDGTPTPNTKPTTRKKADWDAVERDYRTAKFTLRELAEKYGVSHQAIAKRSKTYQWTQDLADQIRQATNAKLVANLVDSEIAKGVQEVANVVLAAATVNAGVILGHRTGLNRLTRIKEKLLDQIEQAAAQLPELAEAIEMVRNPDENGQDKANDQLRKAMSRTSLVDDLKKLAEVDEKVRKGEREAFNIGQGDEDPAVERKPKRILLDFVDAEVKNA